jgi:hypothetical protein
MKEKKYMITSNNRHLVRTQMSDAGYYWDEFVCDASFVDR